MTVWCGNIPRRELVRVAQSAVYYDMLTLEEIPEKQPIGLLQLVMLPKQYHDEQGIVYHFRKIRKALVENNNDEVAAKKYAVGTIFDLLEDIMKKQDNHLFYNEAEYDDWMWVYKEVMTNVS